SSACSSTRRCRNGRSSGSASAGGPPVAESISGLVRVEASSGRGAALIVGPLARNKALYTVESAVRSANEKMTFLSGSCFPRLGRQATLEFSPEPPQAPCPSLAPEVRRMTRLVPVALASLFGLSMAAAQQSAPPPAAVAVGTSAPAFQFKDQSGKVHDLAE